MQITQEKKENSMSYFMTHQAKPALMTALLGIALVASGCASKPKPAPGVGVKPILSSSADGGSSSEAASPNGGSSLPPIAPAQEFSDGAQAGLASQGAAGSAGMGSEGVPASLAQAGNRVYFLTDQSDLTDQAREILARQAAWVKANPSKRVIIAGNADERGTREYNLALGSRRANSVRDYLVGLGVSASAIETVSYGKERPIDARSNEEGWAVNRNAATELVE
jgi:peptidoglycan-associated lipoprotein